MRKVSALVAVPLLVLASCKASDDTKESSVSQDTVVSDTTVAGTTGDTTGSSEFVSTDNRAPGVSDTSIKIGVEYMFFTEEIKKSLRSWHGDYRAMFEAVIDQVNQEGGVHGRTLDPVFYQIDLGVDGVDDAACTALTEDTEVFVVLGYFSSGDQAMCFLDTHETAVVGGSQNDELRAQAKAPWFTAETQGGDAEGDALRALIAGGVLNGTVGVIGTSGDVSYYESTSRPMLDEAGIDIVSEAFVEIGTGDTAADQAAVSTALEGAKAAGVEIILFVGPGVSTTGLDELVKTDWRPAIRFTSRGSIGMFDGDATRDRSILEGAYSAGAFDHADVYLEMTDEPTVWCVDALRSHGIELAEREGWTFESGLGKTWTAAQAVCTQVQLLMALLEKAGPNLDYGTFQHAGETLGEVYLFGDPNPYFYGPGSSVDGDPTLSLYEWDPATNRWVISD